MTWYRATDALRHAKWHLANHQGFAPCGKHIGSREDGTRDTKTLVHPGDRCGTCVTNGVEPPPEPDVEPKQNVEGYVLLSEPENMRSAYGHPERWTRDREKALEWLRRHRDHAVVELRADGSCTATSREDKL